METTKGYLMNENEVRTAYAICDRVGAEFDGIRDRVDEVARALECGTFGELEDTSEELLKSSGWAAAEIAPTWKRC
jgi:hypothetical protein